LPRLAPQLNGQPACVEHRISFGTYERRQLAQAVDAFQVDKALENIPNIMLGTAGIIAAVSVPIVGYQIGLALANAIPFDNGAVAEKYEEMVQNKIMRPLKGLTPIDPSYPGGELPVASYSISSRGVITHAVPQWARVIGIGWVYAQFVKGRGPYRSHGTAQVNWIEQYPEEHAAAMTAQYITPTGTYTPPMGPGAGGPGDFDGDGIPDEYDPDHYS